MKKILIIVFVGLLFHGCVSLEQMAVDSDSTLKEVNKIPRRTVIIKVESKKDTELLYDEIMHLIIANNLSIIRNDDKYHYITTETSVSGFGHKMNVAISKTANGAVAVFKTEFSLSLYSSSAYWNKAIYWGSSDKPTYAIIKTYGIANKIESGKIIFIDDKHQEHVKSY